MLSVVSTYKHGRDAPRPSPSAGGVNRQQSTSNGGNGQRNGDVTVMAMDGAVAMQQQRCQQQWKARWQQQWQQQQ